MEENYFTSWKGVFAICAVVMIGFSTYKIMFRPDLSTRIASQRIEAAFPRGMPNADIMNRQVAAADPMVSVEFSLRQLANYFASRNLEITWEPIDERAFVMRASGVNPLTNQPSEAAFQFIVLDGPVLNDRLIGTFTGPAVGIEAMAIDRVPMNHPQIALELADIVYEVRSQPN